MGVLVLFCFFPHFGYWVLMIPAFCFLLVGFHHRFLPFGFLQTLVPCSGGVILLGVWVILALGPLAVGSSFLIVWAWTCPGSSTLFLCLTLIVAMTFILSNATL